MDGSVDGQGVGPAPAAAGADASGRRPADRGDGADLCRPDARPLGLATLLLAALALLVACGAPSASPTAPSGIVATPSGVRVAPPERPAIDVAATAQALARPTTPTPTLPVARPPGVSAPGGTAVGGLTADGTPLPVIEPGDVSGRVVLMQGDSISLMGGGRVTALFSPPDGGMVKDPIWSPDGGTIAFAYAPPRPSPRAGAPVVEQILSSDIVTIGPDGGAPRALVAHDGPGVILEHPAFAPDGRSLYYDYYRPTYRGDELVGEALEIRRHDLAGGEATLLTDGSNPSISADGARMVYLGEDVSNGQSVRIRDLASGQDRELVKASAFSQLLAPSISPDGATVLFSGASSNPPGGAPRASGPIERLAELFEPTAALAHGFPYEIWTVPSAGGTARPLTRIAEDNPIARYSADGRSVLVFGGGGLYLVDAASGVTRFVRSIGAHGGMDWRSRG